MSVPASVHQAKLAALVGTLTDAELTSIDSPGHAGGFSRSGDDLHGYVLADTPAFDGPLLGASIRWLDRVAHAHGGTAASLTILAHPDAGGRLSRQAGLLSAAGRAPRLSIQVVQGTALAPASPSPLADPPELPATVWALAALFNECGARAVDDHGRLVAELAGLEVARVVDEDGDPVILVGVGQADRELHQLVHRDLAIDAAIRRAVATVAGHRRAGARPHPLNRIARERWLRAALVDDPSMIDLTVLDPVPPLVSRDTVLGDVPVAAVGRDADGRRVVVVCSVGVDLDLAAHAAEYRARHTTEGEAAPRLDVVVPAADRYPVTERLVGLLDDTRLLSIPEPWQARTTA